MNKDKPMSNGPKKEDHDWTDEILERVLNLITNQLEQIDGVWFTGGLTDPNKTELYAEYLGEDKRWHRYTPDFVIRRKAVALQRWEDLNPEVLRYKVVFANGTLHPGAMEAVRDFLN